MARSSYRIGLAIALVGVLSLQTPVAAQGGIGGRLKQKLKDKTAERVEQKTDEAIEGLLNRVECAITDPDCVAAAEAEGKPVKVVDGNGNEVAGGAAAAKKPGQGAWANYDFKPGERILFFDDFGRDEVGDFPRRLEFQTGAVDVVDWEGARWLRATEDSKFKVPLPEVLPDRFTMEFDFAIPAGEVWINFGDDDNQRLEFAGRGYTRIWNGTTKVDANGRYGDDDPDRIRRGRVMGDGRYLKVYIDDKRILNVPNADMERANFIRFWTDARVDQPSLFGNFRIAAGGKKLYDALTAEGRVATQGIYFDTGSDRLRPESTPTLKEIGAMLSEHPDLRLGIEGHTDAVGDDAANQALSQKRAAAVRAYLVAEHGVDGSRLEATGLGETKPVASNDTPEGRQQNRRVELVKLQ